MSGDMPAVCFVRVFFTFSNHLTTEAATGGVLKKVVLKFCKFHRKAPVLESLFIKVEGPEACNFIKRDSDTSAFL